MLTTSVTEKVDAFCDAHEILGFPALTVEAVVRPLVLPIDLVKGALEALRASFSKEASLSGRDIFVDEVLTTIVDVALPYFNLL